MSTSDVEFYPENSRRSTSESVVFEVFKWKHAAPLGLIFLYMLLHFVVRFLISPTMLHDDAEQVLWAQDLALGYEVNQPPLYTWMLIGLFHLVGKGLFAVVLLKYVLLLSTFVILYAVCVLGLVERDRVRMAFFGYLLLHQFAFDYHRFLSHSVMLACALSTTLLCLICIRRQPDSLMRFTLLGFSLAFGFLSKYNFIFFISSAAVCGILIQPWRRVFLNPRMLLSLGTSSLLVAPYLVWLYQQEFSILQFAREETEYIGAYNLTSTGRAMCSYFTDLIRFTIPFGPIALALFPETVHECPQEKNLIELRRFLVSTLLVSLVAFGSMLFAVGAPSFKERGILPLVIFLPIAVFSGRLRVKRTRRMSIYFGLVVIYTLCIIPTRFIDSYFDQYRVGLPTRSLPIRSVFAELLEESQIRPGTIVTTSIFLGGNLSLLFPESRVFAVDDLDQPPDVGSTADLLFVWEGSPSGFGELFGQVLRQDSRLQANQLIAAGQLSAALPFRADQKVRFGYRYIRLVPEYKTRS